MNDVPSDPASLLLAFIVAANDEKFFSQLRKRVRAEYFDPATERLSICLWDCLVHLYDTIGQLPGKTVLFAEMMSHRFHYGVEAEDVQLVTQIYDDYFASENKEPIHAYVKQVMENWLILRGPISDVNAKVQDRYTDSFYESLTKACDDARNLRISTIAVRKLFSYMEECKQGRTKITTGISFVDARLDGGFIGGEVALLLGPTKVGKTTLSVQLACETAIQNRYQGKEKKTAIISYEDDGRSMVNRIICYAARIPVARLLDVGVDGLSDTIGQDYELELIANGMSIAPERQRLESVKWLEEKLALIDLSGRLTNHACGHDGVEEIAEALEMYDTDGTGYNLIVVDWVGILANRYLASRSGRDRQSDLTLYLKNLADEFHLKIASKYDAAVIMVHQLAGAANRHSPVSDVGDTEADGCKSMAVQAWHAMVIRNPDPVTRVSIFDVTRSRRCQKYDPAIIRLNGALGRFEDVSNEYVIDASIRRILHKRVFHEDRQRNVSRKDERFDIC